MADIDLHRLFFERLKRVEMVSNLTEEDIKLFIEFNIIDEDGNILIEKPPPKYYNEVVKNALDNYRENHREKYNERARNYYKKRHKDEKWRLAHNERCRGYNKKYRDKQKQAKIKIHEEVVEDL